MDRIRAISMEIMDKYRSDFGVSFVDNKKALDKVSIIRSKGLKNRIAGFITRFIKHELYERDERERREKEFDRQASESRAEEAAKAEAAESKGTTEPKPDGEAVPEEQAEP